MKTSRAIYSEVTQKFGFMAFNLRMFEDEKKARMGLIECVTHGLVTPYDVVYEKEGNFCFFEGEYDHNIINYQLTFF